MAFGKRGLVEGIRGGRSSVTGMSSESSWSVGSASSRGDISKGSQHGEGELTSQLLSPLKRFG